MTDISDNVVDIRPTAHIKTNHDVFNAFGRHVTLLKQGVPLEAMSDDARYFQAQSDVLSLMGGMFFALYEGSTVDDFMVYMAEMAYEVAVRLGKEVPGEADPQA